MATHAFCRPLTRPPRPDQLSTASPLTGTHVGSCCSCIYLIQYMYFREQEFSLTSSTITSYLCLTFLQYIFNCFFLLLFFYFFIFYLSFFFHYPPCVFLRISYHSLFTISFLLVFSFIFPLSAHLYLAFLPSIFFFFYLFFSFPSFVFFLIS